MSAPPTGSPLAHIVLFTLKDRSPEAPGKLVAQCHKYLKGHLGQVYFSVGTRVPDLNREVNDRDYDVSLHIVFANRQAHDDYQVEPRHVTFVNENKPGWAKVRVFDSYEA